MRKNAVVLKHGTCGTAEEEKCKTANGICKHVDVESTCRHPLYTNKKRIETNIPDLDIEWNVQRNFMEKEVQEEKVAAVMVAQDKGAAKEVADTGIANEASIPLSL
jgi:hypothetical protein